MTYRIITFGCDKCRREYSHYDAARDCELGHITDGAIAGFRADLDNIFPATRKARNAPPETR